jgi:L-threonylcarbamoyladenylate synthase
MREVKGRDKKKPVSILLPSVKHIPLHTRLSPEAKALADKHLPGALTLVLPARKHVPEELTLNGAIGIRVPNDEFSRTLALMSEYPVTATSANLAGLETPETIPEIMKSFGHKIALIDLFIDAGRRGSETASTVVAYINGVPHILREGAISKEELGF